MLMASYSGNPQSRIDYGRVIDGNWSDILNEDINCVTGECGGLSDANWSDVLCEGVSYGTGDHRGCDSDDCELPCTVGHSSRYSSAYPGLSYFSRPAASELEPRNDNDNDSDKEDDEGKGSNDDDDEHINHWYTAGRTPRAFLPQSSEAGRVQRNDDTLIASSAIACRPERASASAPGTYFHPQFNGATDLCSSVWQPVPAKSRIGGCSLLPANDLLALDDDPQTSVMPLFRKLRQKVTCLDNGLPEELPFTSQQVREKPRGHSKPSRLTTWSEFSSSDESDTSNHLFHSTQGHRCRHCSGTRRQKSDGRLAKHWWEISCDEEPECCTVNKASTNHHDRNRRRQKKSLAEKFKKTSSFCDGKLPGDVQLSLPQPSLTKEWGNVLQDWTSFADCLADVESNGTDSDNVGRVIDDDDEYYDYRKTMTTDDTSSALVAPSACNFHYIPPENGEKQTLKLDASYFSGVCDESDNYMSSQGELSASLPDFHISDRDSCRSSCSFGGILHKLLLFTYKLFCLGLLYW